MYLYLFDFNYGIMSESMVSPAIYIAAQMIIVQAAVSINTETMACVSVPAGVS